MKHIIIALMLAFCFTACVNSVPQTYSFSLSTSDLAYVQRFNHLPQLHKGYRNVILLVVDSDGNSTSMQSLIERSNTSSVARAYVQGHINKLHQDVWDSGVSGYLVLARRLVSQFHQDISRDMGKGKLTDKHDTYPHEIPYHKNIMAKVMPKSGSIQTLEQFIRNRMEGNSYDFAVALVSMYEIARDIAKWETFKSPSISSRFYRKLYFELQRYQVIGLTVQTATIKRSLCAVLTYNEDMSRVTMEPQDPQWAMKQVKRAFADNGSFLSLVEKPSGSKFGRKYNVAWLFNSKLAFYSKTNSP